MLPIGSAPVYLTAPNVRPRTSWRCENQPSTMIGAIAISEAADSFAQNCPSGEEYSEMKKLSGAAYLLVRLSVQNASFQDRITLSSRVVEPVMQKSVIEGERERYDRP